MSPLAPRRLPDAAGCSILDAPGPRWFGPNDPIWRVHCDAATPIGITTGLLMLAAEPAYAAMFAASGAVDSPWLIDDYLHDLTEITTLGTVDDAMVTIEHAFRDRGSFSGTTELGSYYYGADPALVEWAHAATTWALLSAYQRFSEHPLTPTETDTYVRQSSRIARLQGARTAPTTVRELERLMRGSRDHARATRTGQRIATRLHDEAHPCSGAIDTSKGAHRSCTTVVDAAASLVPSDVRRALNLPYRPMDRAAVFGRITKAHQGLPTPHITTEAPIAAPSALRVRTA